MNQLKYAFRQLVHRPGLSVLVIGMLAVGIGATTAIYSLIHQTVLETIPVPQAQELVSLRSPGIKPGSRAAASRSAADKAAACCSAIRCIAI
jgi:hypothetical protein